MINHPCMSQYCDKRSTHASSIVINSAFTRHAQSQAEGVDVFNFALGKVVRTPQVATIILTFYTLTNALTLTNPTLSGSCSPSG